MGVSCSVQRGLFFPGEGRSPRLPIEYSLESSVQLFIYSLSASAFSAELYSEIDGRFCRACLQDKQVQRQPYH